MQIGSINFFEDMVGLPPDGWALDHLKVKLRGGSWLIVECFARGAFAIHEIEHDHRRYAQVSHKPTGLKVFICVSVDDAAEAVGLIEPLRDWASITGETTGYSEVCTALLPVFEISVDWVRLEALTILVRRERVP